MAESGDIAWNPEVPVGHTAYSWLIPEEGESGNAQAAPRESKPTIAVASQTASKKSAASSSSSAPASDGKVEIYENESFADYSNKLNDGTPHVAFPSLQFTTAYEDKPLEILGDEDFLSFCSRVVRSEVEPCPARTKKPHAHGAQRNSVKSHAHGKLLGAGAPKPALGTVESVEFESSEKPNQKSNKKGQKLGQEPKEPKQQESKNAQGGNKQQESKNAQGGNKQQESKNAQGGNKKPSQKSEPKKVAAKPRPPRQIPEPLLSKANWQQSPHISASNGTLSWKRKEIGLDTLPPQEQLRVCKEVEYCCGTSFDPETPRVSTFIHDQYVSFCVKAGRVPALIPNLSWKCSKLTSITTGTLSLASGASLGNTSPADAQSIIKEVESVLYERTFPVSAELLAEYTRIAKAANRTPLKSIQGPEAVAVGLEYLRGIERASDKAKGIHYLTQAAEKDRNPTAMALLGQCFQYGDGVTQSLAKAVDYYLDATELKDPFGAIRLARLLKDGVGVEKDEEKSQELLSWAIPNLRKLALALTPPMSSEALSLLHTQTPAN